MQFLNDLLAQWGGGQTPWAQEQMRKMQAGGMPTPDIAQGPSPAMMPMGGGQPPPQMPMQSPMPRQMPTPMRMAGERNPAAPTERAPEPASPSLGTYMAGALRGASQANNPVGALLGAVGGALGAGDEVGQANQTYRLLVSKGVPEQDAALAVKNPRYMQQLLGQLAQASAPMSEADRLDLELKRAQLDQMRNSGGIKPTNDMIEYEQAKRQGYTGTLLDYQQTLKKAGATAITVDQRGDNAFNKKTAEMEADRYGELVKGAQSARSNMANLDALEQALNSYQEGSLFGSGTFGPYETGARSAALALGIGNAETVGAAQLADSIRNKLTLSARSTADGAGMPGALSDADRNFLQATTAGLDKTPEGNKKIIAVNRALEKRRMEVAAKAAQYVEQNGRLDARFDQMLQQWADQNPLFTQSGEGAAATTAPKPGNYIYNPATKQLEPK